MRIDYRSPILIGVASGTAYGVAMRLLSSVHAQWSGLESWIFGVMTVSFLCVVPIVIGFLTVRWLGNPDLLHAIFSGWLPCLLSIIVSAILNLEGAICIVMSLPLLGVMSSVGGLIAWTIRRKRSKVVTVSSLTLPFLIWPVEHALGVPTSLRRVQSEIAIDATPEVVWSQIVRVRAIAPEELEPSLATRMGFPRPIEATLDREGLGGVRRATFEGGVLFLETITAWDEPRTLSFSIAAQTDSIPSTTLDEHVTIGGPYFDVLQGTYTIAPPAGADTPRTGAGTPRTDAGEQRTSGCVLHLESRLRVSTPFNLYAGPWADALMGSIQEQILAVLKKRCESAGRGPR